MNALELADELESFNWIDGDSTVIPYKEAAIMLRQQHAEIEHLKELFEKAMRMIEK
jgi:hypothetical protein